VKSKNDELELKIASDILVDMGIAMIQQNLPNDTEMLGITLGEFKKMAKITDEEIQILKGGN
tara:strand:+ start:189 stop:374 length:186 start_codon:yes stop_codon:yes gene_type:complete